MNGLKLRALIVSSMTCALAACTPPAQVDLPKIHVDRARVTVAGLSAGAYMATQSHLAWPGLFSGAALVAGGPWGCADGQLATALGSCIKGAPAPDVAALAERARQAAAAGKLGPIRDLAGSRVYVLHGKDDTRVAAKVSKDTLRFYDTLRKTIPALNSMQVTWDGDRNFGHNLPVAASGDNCRESVSPFLGHCGFDAAGEIFARLYGAAPRAAHAATGELYAFDQKRFRPDGHDAYLAKTGYSYIPRACLDGASCGVLVVFHGCKQNADAVGEDFVRGAGFNRWADVYHVAVLYPQVRASYAPLNPQACWDWWGYSGADYETRQGVQQQWLMRALKALGVPGSEVAGKQP